MVIKVYTSGISGNKEMKKKQQRIMMILESKNIEFVAIDITEPGNEEEKLFMQDNAVAKDGSRNPIPPQIFNESEYCGDYEGFDVSNENDELEIFLKLPIPPKPVIVNGTHEPTEKDTSIAVSDRQEDLINSMVPNTTLREEPDNEVIKPEIEECVHGFCYTPGLAKRLERALRNRLRKKQPAVHGYCYTPSLAQRLAKALEEALIRSSFVEPVTEPINSVDDTKELEEETEAMVNDEEMEAAEEEETEEKQNKEDTEDTTETE